MAYCKQVKGGSMAKTSYKGKLLTTGQLVNLFIAEEGYIPRVEIRSKENGDRIIKYYAHDKSKNFVYECTYYQIKKHLSESQIKEIELFNEIKKKLDRKNKSFGMFLNDITESEKEAADNLYYKEILNKYNSRNIIIL
jgi:hypothetical protein